MRRRHDAGKAAWEQRWPLLILVLAFLYAGAHLTWYLGTPLGQIPVLDEYENTRLALQIAQHTLPPEPFYRAMGYPLVLAAVARLGASETLVFAVGLWLGVMLHAVSAALAMRLAYRWFDSTPAAILGGTLFALNPILVHHATQLVDTTMGIFLVLATLVALPRAGISPSHWRLLATGLLSGTAVVVRPNYLLLVGALLFVGLWFYGRAERRFAPSPLLYLGIGLAIPTASYAGWQWHVCGHFGLMPSQGTYNLWAANRPGAHGRYFSQSITIPPGQPHENPTKLESVALYCAETGLNAAASMDDVNAHWRRRLLTSVREHPMETLKVLGRKAYALANDWEQYNNKTYAFHKVDSPWLRLNPIGWGLLLILAIPGGFALLAQDRRLALIVGLVLTALTASALVVYVSSRFRLPLEAILCALAGGSLTYVRRWSSISKGMRIGGLALTGCAALVAFSDFDQVRDRRTFLQDHLLIASAAERTGNDQEAWNHAREAHQLAPENNDAIRTMVAAYFNLLIQGTAPAQLENDWADAAKSILSDPQALADPMGPIAALACWRQDATTGTAYWEKIADHSPNSIARANAAAALVLSGRRPAASLAATATPHPFLVRIALGELADPPSSLDETVRALFRPRVTLSP